MLSFHQVFAVVPAEQQSDAPESQALAHAGEPMLLDGEFLSHVSGGATSIPVGGW